MRTLKDFILESLEQLAKEGHVFDEYEYYLASAFNTDSYKSEQIISLSKRWNV